MSVCAAFIGSALRRELRRQPFLPVYLNELNQCLIELLIFVRMQNTPEDESTLIVMYLEKNSRDLRFIIWHNNTSHL